MTFSKLQFRYSASCKPDFCIFSCSLHEMHVHCMQIYEKLMLHVQIVQRTKDIAKLSDIPEATPKRKF